jgi:CheY-like chemotaxis protein
MILLVEDEAITRNAFAQILSINGHRVMQAADGQEAVTLLEKNHFDIVITDIRLPKLSGLSLTAQIRMKWPDTAVLLVSAYLAPEDTQHLLDGKVEFLSKPVNANEMVAIINRLAAA